jgi:glutathione S-transferase
MNVVYGAILSPFVRKVLMLLEYKGVEYKQETVFPFRNPPEFARISPLRKVPAFQDEYITISDSSVICDYLEHKYPQAPLYPKNPAARARALWLEEFADTRLQEVLGPGFFFERLVARGLLKREPNEALIDRSLKLMPALHDYLEMQLSSGAFLAGSELTIADLSVPSMFLNAHYAGHDVDPRRWPKLADYLQRMFAHPLYAKRIEAERTPLEGMRAQRRRDA